MYIKNFYKKFLILMTIFTFYNFKNYTYQKETVAFSETQDKKDKKEDTYDGIRSLLMEARVTAEYRYTEFIKSFKADNIDIQVFKNDTFYIKNGYYDYGFVPKQNHPKHGELKDSFWVFVYPKWHLWKKESLNFRDPHHKESEKKDQ